MPILSNFPETPTLIPPIVDLSDPHSIPKLIQACQEFGFFKVVNHGVPVDSIAAVEKLAIDFFSLPDNDRSCPPEPFNYGRNKIGPNGDVGWVEYLILTNAHSLSADSNTDQFRHAVNGYLQAVREMSCRILEMVAEGLNIHRRDAFSKLLMHEQSDSVFRVNHYPPSPSQSHIGFGAHTDPQIISVLRSNNASGLQIAAPDGQWVSVPPDQESFFVNVGDSLQVMTNGRFRSVRHRVVANSPRARVSMIYFGGPPPGEKIAPAQEVVGRGEDSLYKEFTWFEYKKSVYNSRLADNRLGLFEKIAAS